MGKVVDFALHRAQQGKDWHIAGIGRCFKCKHEWAAVGPAGADVLECPECGCDASFVKYVECQGKLHWTCHCGCQHFANAEGYGWYCINCGKSHDFSDVGSSPEP